MSLPQFLRSEVILTEVFGASGLVQSSQATGTGWDLPAFGYEIPWKVRTRLSYGLNNIQILSYLHNLSNGASSNDLATIQSSSSHSFSLC